LDFIVPLYAKSQPRYYERFTGSESSNHVYIKVYTEGDFPTANVVDEGGVINFDDFATPYNMDVYFQMRALGYAQSSLAESSDLYGILAKRGKKMVDSIYRAMEYDASDFLNLGTSGNSSNQLLTPDGVTFFSAAHLYALGTFSNIVTGNPALSITALAQAQQQLMNQPSHEGSPITFEGPKILMVPTALADLAYRLTNTDGGRQPQSGADADKNWAGRDITVVVNPFFTSTTAWALVTADKAKNPMKMITRRGLVTKEQPDISRDGTLYTVTCVWAKAPFDPRGIVYSAGA
jgi:hypothetical protein